MLSMWDTTTKGKEREPKLLMNEKWPPFINNMGAPSLSMNAVIKKKKTTADSSGETIAWIVKCNVGRWFWNVKAVCR